jgi:hypothetical protein
VRAFILAIVAALSLLSAPACAQSPSCGPQTGTLAGPNDAVSLTCMGFPSYEVLITPNASAPLVGTIQAYDPVSGSNRALFKAGVGELDVSTAPMTGTTGAVLYRLVSFNGGAIKLAGYTSGSATVTIWGSSATSGTFQNNPVHTTEEGALRNGRAFTASSSVAAVPAGQNLSFVLSNPSSNSLRLIVGTRVVSCDGAAGTAIPKYYGVSNPTVNLPATAATVTNRRTGGAVSASTAVYGVAATRPDTNPTTATPAGGVVPTGGFSYQLPGLTTIEPGTSRGTWIANTTGATINCSWLYQWIEETTQ